MDLVAGLDIGTTKVCAVIAEIDEDGKVNLIGVGLSPNKGLRKGVVIDIDDTVSAIQDAVAKAQNMAGRKLETVFVGVTGEHISSLNSRGIVAVGASGPREISTEDVNRVVDNSRIIVLPPDREIIHAIPRGFSIDGQSGIRRPVGMYGTRLEVETHIVTGAVTFLQNVERCVQKAGLIVEETILEPIASSHAVLEPIETDIGVALIDIGGGTSDVAVFVDGAIVYSGVVPIGGQYVTLDLSKLLRITPDEAERLKIEYGCAQAEMIEEDDIIEVTQIGSNTPRSLPRRVLAEIIQPRMEELFGMVKQHLRLSGYDGLLPAGVVLTGGGSKLNGATELADALLGPVPVRIGVPGNIGGLVDAVTNPMHATAIGLVIYGAMIHKDFIEKEADSWLKLVIQHVKNWLSRLSRKHDGLN